MRNISRSEAREQIRKLNRIDPRSASYDSIRSTFNKITHGLNVVVGIAGGGEMFYRARVASKKPVKITELHAPPAHLVRGYQRCNPPLTPMFYAASQRAGALLETRVSEGDTVYLSQWIARDRIPVNRIFDSEENQAVNGMPAAAFSGPNDDLLLAYLDTQFTRRIHASFADDYKFTAAIAQFLTCNFHKDDEHTIRDDGHVALKYPSVLGLDTWHNTAMHAEFASKRLELLHVMELKVLSVNDSSIRVDILDTATTFEAGVICWSSDPSLVPTLLEKNRAVPFIFDGRKWNLQLFEGPVTAAYVEALLSN
ncbi:RES domain-containing protein [Pseudomonas sp. RA_5y_Pfl1_P24]|uniref:RES domain-containing protein n=1 Tax=Pseudomonas sp. RA_5y_Pfl1_P24 TaxID=3088706 RepID=UPI0030DDD6BB